MNSITDWLKANGMLLVAIAAAWYLYTNVMKKGR